MTLSRWFKVHILNNQAFRFYPFPSSPLPCRLFKSQSFSWARGPCISGSCLWWPYTGFSCSKWGWGNLREAINKWNDTWFQANCFSLSDTRTVLTTFRLLGGLIFPPNPSTTNMAPFIRGILLDRLMILHILTSYILIKVILNQPIFQ